MLPCDAVSSPSGARIIRNIPLKRRRKACSGLSGPDKTLPLPPGKRILALPQLSIR